MRMLRQKEGGKGGGAGNQEVVDATCLTTPTTAKRDYDKQPVFDNKIGQLSFDILFLVYADLHRKIEGLGAYLLAFLFSFTFLNIGPQLEEIWTRIVSHVFIAHVIQAFQPENVKSCCAQVVEKRIGGSSSVVTAAQPAPVEGEQAEGKKER